MIIAKVDNKRERIAFFSSLYHSIKAVLCDTMRNLSRKVVTYVQWLFFKYFSNGTSAFFANESGKNIWAF